MTDQNADIIMPQVVVLADVESNAHALVDRVLKPAGIKAWVAGPTAPPPDILLVDVTQLRGDPMAGLREQRERGISAPAIMLAAHIPRARLQDMFRLGVRDFLLKPYRPDDLRKAILELGNTRSPELNTHALARRLDILREQLRRRSEEVRILSEIGRVVVDLGNLDSILRRVVEAAAFVTDAEEASIYMFDEEENDLVLRATKQAGDRYATLQRLRIDDTLTGRVFKSGAPVLKEPTLDEEPHKVQTGFLVRSLIKVPIRMKTEVVGVLGVYNRLSGRAFTEHQMTVLSAFAQWIGVALEHAELLRESDSAGAAFAAQEAVPPTYIENMERAIATLKSITQDPSESLPFEVEHKLRTLEHHLQEMRGMPVATLSPDEARDLVDLPRLIRTVVQDLRPIAARQELELIAEDEDAIPLFKGDPSGIRRVLETLTRAALRRTHRGRVALESHRFQVRDGRTDTLPLPADVHLTDGYWVAVRVSDTSTGLSPDTVRALTDPSGDPSSGQIGPGLSLGEVRMIVESMGGVLWHDQTPASTSITFSFPLA
jgi:signal transduction histidine kinase